MIPKLYESNETEFKTNGLGSLSDAISCKVTEERNGAFELEMEYPVGGLHYDLIEANRIIYAKPNETSEPQPFDIKEVTLSMDGMKATIYAQHMRYRLNGVPIKPFSATGIVNALQGLVDNALINMGFTVWTDIDNTSSKFELKEPNTFGQLLGGTDGSILDVFSGSSGCEYEFNKKAIKLWAHRGSDSGVTIRYGKNLKGCKMETNIESVYTGVLAYWTKEDDGTTTSIQGEIQYIDNHENYPREQIYLLDCSSDYTEQPSISELNAKAKAYGINNNIGEPSVSADVEFYQLWQTEEFKNVAPLERVSLCDTVHVIFRELGCDVSAIVNKTVYDTLAERYDSIAIGSAKSKLGDTVKQVAHDIIDENNFSTDSWVQDQITKTVDKIRGGTNGHVILATNANGETNELYAYNGDSLSSASKVLRLNYEGIAGSSNGLNGKYSLAISTDGTINADMITTGTLKAINIEGTTIKGSTISGNTISGGTISGTTINFGSPTVMTLKENGTTGALFDGSGWVNVKAVGGYSFENFTDSNKTTLRNKFTTSNVGTTSSTIISNFQNGKNASELNLETNASYNVFRQNNYGENGKIGNFFQMMSTNDGSNTRTVYINNYSDDTDESTPYPVNKIQMRSVDGVGDMQFTQYFSRSSRSAAILMGNRQIELIAGENSGNDVGLLLCNDGYWYAKICASQKRIGFVTVSGKTVLGVV